MLQHLMAARKLTQKDLWMIFGSKGITSKVFHAKRSISKTQAKKLAAFSMSEIVLPGKRLGTPYLVILLLPYLLPTSRRHTFTERLDSASKLSFR